MAQEKPAYIPHIPHMINSIMNSGFVIVVLNDTHIHAALYTEPSTN
jgi:hypothetical protein